MTQHTKYVNGWEMPHSQKIAVAKEIAKLLAESTATVDDMFDVFQMVREYLVVCKLPETEEGLNEL